MLTLNRQPRLLILTVTVLTCLLSGCFQPPYNEFKSRPHALGLSDSNETLIRKLNQRGIQVIHYGKKNTVIVPTDRYFVFDSGELNEVQYAGLYNLKEFLIKQKNKHITIAAFTDNVGSAAHKQQLTRARAETMRGFLWANGIPARLLNATGYGDEHPVANNQLIHASAYNRRIEIQWMDQACLATCLKH